MKILYLILCHKNENQVVSLINQLNDEDVSFCIHVDKKAQFTLKQKSNIYFVDDGNRVDVQWGDMGMVTATLRLIELGLQHGPFDYIALISGQDFPIKSKNEIKSFLNSHNGTNWIDINTDNDNSFNRMLKRVELYYPKWMQQRTFFSKALKRLYVYGSGGFNYTFKIFRRKLPCNMPFSYGSSWWILTYDTVKWMNQFVKDHKEILTFFENSTNPDECFFQCLFLISPYAGTEKKNVTYVEWDSSRNHPRILLKDDVPMLLKQPHLFARKFDESINPNVINTLIDSIGE